VECRRKDAQKSAEGESILQKEGTTTCRVAGQRDDELCGVGGHRLKRRVEDRAGWRRVVEEAKAHRGW
jgi:hypothetical protein